MRFLYKWPKNGHSHYYIFLWFTSDFPWFESAFEIILISVTLNCLRHSHRRRPQFVNNSTDDPEKSMTWNLKVGHVTKTNRQARQKVGHTALFVVTLLTPTNDPNKFGLMAGNLKMKARGNQKHNLASQIKSSPHDRDNHQRILHNQLQIDVNRGLD